MTFSEKYAIRSWILGVEGKHKRTGKMQIDNEMCLRFPVVLRDKLLKKEIELPDTVFFDYEPVLVYRAAERKKEDDTPIQAEDFKSYFELKKTPKGARGVKKDWKKDPHYYGVSSYLDRKIVEQMMKFPNPRKKMAVGYVHKEGGPQETNKDTKHVCWWLYEDADVSGFEIEEG